MRPSRPLVRVILSALAAASLPAGSSRGASLSKSYSYFTVGGTTLSEIEADLARRGPHVASTARRHPGATTLSFKTKLRFAEASGSCRVVGADVSVGARMALPRWRRPRAAGEETRLIWDTLSADIKRHEESHAGIAKSHAGRLERALRRLGKFGDCAQANAKAQALTEQALARHDAEQARFDRVEGWNFDSRFLRLLQRRLDRLEAAGNANP